MSGHCIGRWLGWCLIATAIGSPRAAIGATVTLTPIKDNTLIQNTEGAFSNGASEGIFCGRLAAQGGGLRLRAVLAFDLTSIPAGSTVSSASLTLHIAQAVGGNQTHTLHRLLKNWGEGTSYAVGGSGAPSTPNDATWIHTFFPNTFWSAAGGDFLAAVSASKVVGNSGTHVWTSAALAADVQGWITDPATNFGWVLRGNENVMMTAKKFVSREGEITERPKLTINYTLPPPPPCPADITGDNQVDVDDVLSVIDNWGQCAPPPEPCPFDIAPRGGRGGNGTVDVDDLLAVINAWGPCP